MNAIQLRLLNELRDQVARLNEDVRTLREELERLKQQDQANARPRPTARRD